jgi:hypothetical protein
MKRTEAVNSQVMRSQRRTRRRAGILVAWTIWIMLAACLISGAVFNIIYISGVRTQARHCASSAVLAGGYGYLSDDMLRMHQESFEIEGRSTRCRQKALSIVEECRRNSHLPSLTENDIHLTFPRSLGPSSEPWLYVPTEIAVCFDSESHRNGLPQFFSGLTGIRKADIGIRAMAKLEHSPVAFRPGKGVNVPILPFAICDRVVASGEGKQAGEGLLETAENQVASGYWSNNAESGKGQDAYSWSDEKRQFENGPDGLPEVTVTIYSSSSAGHDDAFIPMLFAQSGIVGSSSYARWIHEGLSTSDLTSDTEIRFPGTMNVGLLKPTDLLACRTALENRIGEPLIVALCALSSTSELKQMTLDRPVSARIVRVTNAASGSIKVVLQPCVLVTSTAVTSSTPSAHLNRYIYSVRLSQ